MQVEIGSELARQLFPSTFDSTPFQSLLPPHQFLVTALSDPSVTPQSLSNVIGVDVLNAAGAKDLQIGAQRMLYTMVLRYEGVLSGLSNGIPTDMREPLELVSKFAWKFGSAIGDDTLDEFLIESAWAGGMKALGALGPIGKAAAAIAGFAREVIRTFQDMKKMQAADALQRERMVFARMPPLQQPNEETDTFIVNTVVMPAMETGAWTRLFLPRFSPRGSWKGIERNGGFAFAPGKSIKGSTDEFGREVDVFDSAGGGVGMVPGFDQVSSVIQVSADPFSPAMRAFKEGTPGNINWPIGPDQVIDVGRYYINTGRLCAIAWAWATEADASPHLYKIHVGEPGKGDGHLHDAWENYCAGGIRYLTEMAEDWQQGGKKMLLSGNLEYVYGSGLALAVGAWTCTVDGGTTEHPTYLQLQPGRVREEMVKKAKFMRPDHWLGFVMTPKTTLARGEGQPCLRSLYETHIRPLLLQARSRQVYFLRHSLVCAYVREGWDAFKDKPLLDLLRKQRQLLLTHPDRMLVNLDDVPEKENFNGSDFREQLIAAGVKRRPPFVAGGSKIAGKSGGSPGTLEPTDEPPPRAGSFDVPMPFADAAPARCGRDCVARRRLWKYVGLGTTAAAALGAGGYYAWQRMQEGDR